MRRLLRSCVVAALAMFLATSLASGQFYQQRSQYRAPPSSGFNHITVGDPAKQREKFGPQPSYQYGASLPRTAVLRSAPPAPPKPVATPPQTDQQQQFHQHHHHAGLSNGIFTWGGGYPLIWSGGYTPAFVPYDPVAYPMYAPMPAQQPQPAVRDPVDNDPLVEAPAKGKPKPTSPEQKAKAGKFIGYGDVNFGKQKYLPAIERYKTAAQMAPDTAEPYLRQGFSLVALGQYENAAKVFRRGLGLRSDWNDSPFRLDQIYGDDRLAKTMHLENLAKAVEANPLDSNLLFALGMQIFFDGQHDRAEVFFARAAQLGGNEDRLLNGFLPKPAPAGAVRDAAAGKIVF